VYHPQKKGFITIDLLL